MKLPAPQHVVDLGAFLLASCRAQNRSDKGWLEQCERILHDTCLRNYPADDRLEADIRNCAEYAEQRVCGGEGIYPSRDAQLNVLRWCAEFAEHVEPDGSRRKISLAIFGGLFRGRAPIDRRATFQVNFLRYMMMAINQHMVSLIVPCPFHGEACPTQRKFREAMAQRPSPSSLSSK